MIACAVVGLAAGLGLITEAAFGATPSESVAQTEPTSKPVATSQPAALPEGDAVSSASSVNPPSVDATTQPRPYLHQINPFAIRFHGDFGIRWYGLSYLWGFFLGYLLVHRVVAVGRSTLKPQEVGDMTMWLALGIVLGGRLGFVFFYQPELLTQISGSFPYWGVIAINQGGMASHGGMIGGIVASYLYARANKHSWAHMLDLFAFGAPLGLFFGRIANFINGELYGRECPPTFSLAVQFPQEITTWKADDQRLTTLFDALPFTHRFDPTEHFNKFYQALIDEQSRGNPQVIAALRQVLPARYPSQLFEAVLEGLVVFFVLAIIWWKPRKPLVVGASFGIVYGLVRIIGEQFRMPDHYLLKQEFQSYGVTRGQWLSGLLILAGVVLLIFALNRKVAPMGGWRRIPGIEPTPPTGEKPPSVPEAK